MHPVEFLVYAVENWLNILLWTIFFGILLFLAVRKLAVGGIFDPIHFAYTFTFGTKYAVVFTLYFNGLISNYLFSMIVIFGMAFYVSLIYSSKLKQPIVNNLFSLLVPKNNHYFEFKVIFLIYSLIAVYIISNIGFGFFAETNRFDNNKGFGAFVRITDVLGTFIIAYLSIIFYERYRLLGNYNLGQFLRYFSLLLFIIFFTILNGAKAAFVFAFITIILAIRASGYKLKVGIIKGTVLILIATVIAMLGLYINLLNNNMEASGEGKLTGAPIVLEKFVGRIIANGNQSYMSLPNNVIEEIQTDNIFIRLMTPFIGTSLMSKIVGYPANDLSVGRQILFQYDSNNEVAGGPTSHFDLFSYVYFGYGGIVFVIFLGYLIGSINMLLRTAQNKSIFYVSLITTLWIRAMALLLEPPTGIGYIFDLFIIFILLNIFIYILNFISTKEKKYVC
ncbi:O-antigen polymerase [Arcobacter porcinus]|uniref:Oligosaccharide repeat unit polymerase n=1 Tax=Arcobacter porcinus TaxID=1935204 RepID=A0ABX2YD64_9BACT|nr:O-antigen polymerase [Arcobacter porcinus]OCL92936.1 hypothetical protein AAX28_00476 [Arcobacter porcinus]